MSNKLDFEKGKQISEKLCSEYVEKEVIDGCFAVGSIADIEGGLIEERELGDVDILITTDESIEDLPEEVIQDINEVRKEEAKKIEQPVDLFVQPPELRGNEVYYLRYEKREGDLDVEPTYFEGTEITPPPETVYNPVEDENIRFVEVGGGNSVKTVLF